jgi:cholera toxin transcriptional activator
MANEKKLRFGLYEANLESGELFKGGQKLRLQEQPFQVLVALLERPSEVVTRDELRERLWPADTFVDFEHSLNTAINKVRDALGDTATNPRFIETLPRRGYRFIAPIQIVPETSAAIANSTAAPVANTSAPAVSPTGIVAESTSAAHHLPEASHGVSRTLFGSLQLMYLVFYTLALWKLPEVEANGALLGLGGKTTLFVVVVSGTVGIALRLYTLNATLFNYRLFGKKFQRAFPLVLIVDVIWAMSPFLIAQKIGIGLAFAACAALVYSPFAQRVLALMAWREK